MSRYSEIKAVIFDVDGTLLDSMGIWDDIGGKYLRKIGIEPEPELKDILFTMSIEEGAAYVDEHYHLGKGPEEVAKGVVEIIRDFYYEEAQLKHGVRETLELLKAHNIPMTVATSSEKDSIEHAFLRLGILDYFEKIFTCTEENTSKNTSPKIYLKAAEYMGSDPEDTWVFEDVLHAIETAKRAGFHTVAVYDSASEKDQLKIKEKADIYLQDLAEIDKLIKNGGLRNE